jgi:5-enolpyruvylshikimate-3-phosphate synthase
MAMTGVCAAASFGIDVEIDDLNCIGVSYPGFLGKMKSLGGIR